MKTLKHNLLLKWKHLYRIQFHKKEKNAVLAVYGILERYTSTKAYNKLRYLREKYKDKKFSIYFSQGMQDARELINQRLKKKK